jgi:hypothetical protein
VRDHGGPAIFYSCYLANWKIGLSVAASFNLMVSWLYRAASNRLADAVIQGMRLQALLNSDGLGLLQAARNCLSNDLCDGRRTMIVRQTLDTIIVCVRRPQAAIVFVRVTALCLHLRDMRGNDLPAHIRKAHPGLALPPDQILAPHFELKINTNPPKG